MAATKAEWAAVAIAGIALVISVPLSLYTLWVTEWRGPRLSIGLPEEILVNKKPRIGFLSGIYNSGAKPGIVVKGMLKWDDQQLQLRMTSPQFHTWTYDAKGKMRDLRDTEFTLFSPLVALPRTSQPAVLWFTREDYVDLFTEGWHVAEIKLFDGIGDQPIVWKQLDVEIGVRDRTNIHAPGMETTEFRVRAKSRISTR